MAGLREERIPLMTKTKDVDEADDSFLNKLWRIFMTPSSSSSSTWSSSDSPHHHQFLSYCYYQGYPRIFITDARSRKVREAGLIDELKGARLASSICNGLILLTCRKPYHQHVVFDPMSNRIVTRISPLFWGGSPCGFYYHPVANEYRVLNVHQKQDHSYEYRVYLSGARKWRKALTPNYRCLQPEHCFPEVTSEALYWYHSHSEIMVFDIVAEEFCYKLLPGRKEDVFNGDILAQEDGLFCLFAYAEEAEMDVWVLESYASWCWERKYTVGLDWDAVEFPLRGGISVEPSILEHIVGVVSIQGDEVVLCWKHRGVFLIHCGKKTVERIMLDKADYDNLFWECGLLTFSAAACTTTS